MSSLLVSFNAIVPLFLVIATGYLVKRAGIIGPTEVKRFNSACFYTFMPVMLFYDIYTSDISSSLRPFFFIYTVGMILLLTALTVLFVLKVERDNACRGVMIQGAFRSNFVLLGLPIATALLEKDISLGVTALTIAIVVPLFNVMAVVVLETFRGGKIHPGRILLNILKNPLIIGGLGGLALKLLHVPLPQFLLLYAGKMESGCFAIALFLLGAAFEFNFLSEYRRDLIIIILLRLVIFPAAALLGAVILGIRGVEFVTLIALFGAPCAINSFNMAMQMGGNKDLASSAVMTTSALSFFSLFVWVTLFKWLGMF
ncbi:MAG: AEC family transporter [Firmicutes bacterium]|nr:AEC family transporter [Bacillota bacterium]